MWLKYRLVLANSASGLSPSEGEPAVLPGFSAEDIVMGFLQRVLQMVGDLEVSSAGPREVKTAWPTQRRWCLGVNERQASYPRS